ncbi:Oxysterol-binding protein-like protein 1 [Leucoagaricus sp. SymC.cos]|nr:Oxysterol-binding protein-like protein 1 [Leucoagaricus sp. SymC.cos]
MSHNEAPAENDHVVIDEDAPGPPISVPDSGDTGEGGKLKMIVQLVKKCLGVKDIATMRLSLPASLLEPVPNLEYWQYLDRPDLFAAVNDAEFPFERMLSVVRFAFTKDLKFVHGKVCKPYNSVLGEHFRAHWDVPPVAYDDAQTVIPLTHTTTTSDSAVNISDSASIKSGRSSKSTRSGFSAFSKAKASTPATSPPQSVEANVAAQMSNLSLGNDPDSERLRVVYVTEQVSHHPPVSTYYASCPKRNLEMFGIDQISAKVSGTTVKVSPGQFNQGIFINLTGGFGEGERYHITHPVASVNGILRGSFYVTVSESTIITCTGGKPGTKFRAIIEYKEESWLGRAHFLIEGVIHTVHEGEDDHEEWTKVKHVPADRVVAVFDGSWRGHIRWRRVGAGSYPNAFSSSASSPSPSHEHLATPDVPKHAASRTDVSRLDTEYSMLIDLSALQIIPKEVRPLEKQLPHESRKLWKNVTDNLMKKEYSEATREKVTIEQRQRDEAAERKRKGTEFIPKYFEKDLSTGYAKLTEEGWKAVKEELEESIPTCVEA